MCHTVVGTLDVYENGVIESLKKFGYSRNVTFSTKLKYFEHSSVAAFIGKEE